MVYIETSLSRCLLNKSVSRPPVVSAPSGHQPRAWQYVRQLTFYIPIL